MAPLRWGEAIDVNLIRRDFDLVLALDVVHHNPLNVFFFFFFLIFFLFSFNFEFIYIYIKKKNKKKTLQNGVISGVLTATTN